MRIVEIRERTVPISRYADPAVPSGGLDTSIVAVMTDIERSGRPVTGFGFASIGRFAQGGLIRERFAPRLLSGQDEKGDPLAAWHAMMADEKPGGHGERCVAVGALDMAVWDAAAKIADLPLYRYVRRHLGIAGDAAPVPIYASGGYPWPEDDLRRLIDEIRMLRDLGYDRFKIKIGAGSLSDDLRRIETVLGLLPSGDRLAVDAMNRYDRVLAETAATRLVPYGLRWFEDACDPLDFETQAALAEIYEPPIAAGEALFSAADARNLLRYGGLRPGHDVLEFDPAHCYGLPGYLEIIETAEAAGWNRTAFWPHGGHLYSLHLAAALGLGGTEVNPHNFQPFGGLVPDARIENGTVMPLEATGIGFETRPALAALFRELLDV